VAWAGLHFGEEPCFTGTGGVANFFFSSCSLACVYCQNHQISQGRAQDTLYTKERFAREALLLQARGACFTGLVSPSCQGPQIREALVFAKKSGLKTPVVYNTSAYDSLEQLRALDGLVDVWMPDLKYADEEMAARYSKAPGYVAAARDAVLEMRKLAGDIQIDPETGLAVRGVWARHLVLPGGVSGTWETLCFLALEAGTGIGLSLMSQYTPLHKAGEYPEIARRLLPEEYAEAVGMARSLGFKHLLVQDLEESPDNAVPDFTDTKQPFKRF
jgi:putative pyruvate formate lyase activating enzyme